MKLKTSLALVSVVLALVGCSKPGEQVPDYHSLLVMGGNGSEKADPNYPAYHAAKMKCEEAGTGEAATTDPWCIAVQKADMCSSYAPLSGAVRTGSAWAAYVAQHPVDGCPAK